MQDPSFISGIFEAIDLYVDGEAINFIQSLTLPSYATLDGNFILEMKGLSLWKDELKKPSATMTDNASTGASRLYVPLRFGRHIRTMTNSFGWDDPVLPPSNDVSTTATCILHSTWLIRALSRLCRKIVTRVLGKSVYLRAIRRENPFVLAYVEALLIRCCWSRCQVSRY